MSVFSESIHHYWSSPFAGQTIYQDERLAVVINPDLDEDESVTILHWSADRSTSVALLPELAQSLQTIGVLGDAKGLTEGKLRDGLLEIGIVMHGADNLYYLPRVARDVWLLEAEPQDIRKLDANDAALFAEFESQSSEQDLDAAQVDLEDWAVFGVFGQQGQLLSVASIYPWGESPVVDIGILTLASARGTGCAKRLLRAVGRYAMAKGYELQYRSQLDNQASLALAKASGLELLGSWEIPSPDEQA